MIELRFKDIDPDTGRISQDKLIATCPNPMMGEWVRYAIEQDFGGCDPNREFYLSTDKEAYATYEQRILWFIDKYYETGMEYEIIAEEFKEYDLSDVPYKDGTISIPRLCKELV